MTNSNTIVGRLEDIGIEKFSATSSIVLKDRILFFKEKLVCGEILFFYNGIEVRYNIFDYRNKLKERN